MANTNDVTYIEQLPVILNEIPEFQELHETFTENLSESWDAVNEVFDNQFLDTLTEIGCRHWEAILNITPITGATLEDRRSDIKTKINAYTPYTMNYLKERLTSYLGETGYSATVDFASYILKIVMFTLDNQNQADLIMEMLTEMKPANMVLNFCSQKDDRQKFYIGHATKSIKTLEVTDPETYDPLEGHSWYVDDNEDVYIDHNRNILGA